VVADEFLVEVRIGIRGAGGGDQQLRALKIRGVHRRQLDLHRPLGQPGDGLGGGLAGGRLLPAVNRPGLGAGTAAGHCTLALRVNLGVSLFLLVGFDRRAVVLGGLALGEGDGVRRTGRQAVAQSVAVVVAEQLGLAVHHADGPFVAGRGTGAAAVTFFFVYMDNFPFHGRFLLLFQMASCFHASMIL